MRPAWCGASRDAAQRLWWPTWCLPFWAVTPLPRHIPGHTTGLLVTPSSCWNFSSRGEQFPQPPTWRFRVTRAASSCEFWDCLFTSLSLTWPLLHTRGKEKSAPRVAVCTTWGVNPGMCFQSLVPRKGCGCGKSSCSSSPRASLCLGCFCAFDFGPKHFPKCKVRCERVSVLGE